MWSEPLAPSVLRLANIGLRIATLGARFIFIFFLAKYLDPSSVGYYGIFTATVGYAIYFVGLDFYIYASREIIKTPPQKRGQLLKGQAVLSGLLYLGLLPLAVSLLSRSGWPGHLVWWFVPILFLEHLNQEITRLLGALSEQLTSSAILFIRQGSWTIVIILLMGAEPSVRTLDFAVALWALAGIAAASVGVWRLKKINTQGWSLPVDWAWIKKGVAVSAAFLLATLALRGVQTFDRYWLEALSGIESVGAYVLLLGVAGTLLTFLDAAVFAFAYPALIKLNHEGRFSRAQLQVRRLLFQTIFISVAFAFVSWLLLPYFLSWIGNPAYQRAAHYFPWLLAAMIFNALSMVPHFALYARGRDKPIIYSHIGALFVFGVVTWLLSKTHAVLAVPLGLNAAFACILISKSAAYVLMLQCDDRISQEPIIT